jgi:hypothetical protein
MDVDGTPVRPLGDEPLDYLVYTTDGYVFYTSAIRGERVWPGPEVLEMPPHQRVKAIGFAAYCRTFEVRDGQVLHHREFGVSPRMSRTTERRSVTLDGDRLVLDVPRPVARIEWRRVHTEGNPQ